MAGDYLSETVQLRLKPTERREIDRRAKAAGLKRSQYLRRAGLEWENPQVNRETYQELGRAGVNLNQLARAANAAARRGEPLDVDPNVLEDLAQQVRQLQAELRPRG